MSANNVLITCTIFIPTEPRDSTLRPTEPELSGKNDLDVQASQETPKPPSKKRKIDTSPPWKSATTQTPTSFMVDGRRKSGRTNPIPTELMPPTINGSNGVSTRQTRSSLAKAENSKVGKVATSKTNRHTLVSPLLSTKGKTNQKPLTRASTPAPPQKNPQSSIRRVATSTPSKQDTQRRSGSKVAQSKVEPSPKTSPNRPQTTYSGTRRTSARTAARVANESFTTRTNQTLKAKHRKFDEFSFDSDGEADVGPDWKPPKIKIRFRRTPPLTITHPLHVLVKPIYESFEAFLDSEEVLGDKKGLQEEEAEAREEAKIRQRIESACEDGVLAPERCSLLMPEERPGPPRLYYHYDQLIAHALNFQKLMERERRYHMGLAKKLAGACAQKVQESIPKTKEELEEEMVRETFKLHREAVVVGIRNKWALITEVLEHHQSLVVYISICI